MSLPDNLYALEEQPNTIAEAHLHIDEGTQAELNYFGECIESPAIGLPVCSP